MALLSKDAIWQAEDLVYEDVFVKEWNGNIRIRAMSGYERDAFEAASLVKKGDSKELNTRNLRARLIAATAINEDGSPLFDPADIIHLGQKSAAPISRLFDVATRLSGMSKDDVSELTENFDVDQNVASTSD